MHLLCEDAGIFPPCQYEEEGCKKKENSSDMAGLSNCRFGILIIKGLLSEVQTRFTFLKNNSLTFAARLLPA